MKAQWPLAIDLDGTLVSTDGLMEAVATAVLRNPKSIPRLVRCLSHGRAAFKTALAVQGAYRPGSLPLREDFVEFLREQKAAGRALHLVTASPQAVADAMAARLGLFDSTSGTMEGINLKGPEKARHLSERFPDGFSYAGCDSSDLAVWQQAKGAVVVAASPRVERKIAAMSIPVERRFPKVRTGLSAWVRLLRIHQWSKNLLILIPLGLTHRYTDPAIVFQMLLAILCMGLVASATYIVNDLSDLDSDRRHETKRTRPLASAEISAAEGGVAALVLGGLGMLGALLLDHWFAACLTVYLMLTVAYSLGLKAIALLDVFVLGLLYTLRILMGIALLRVPPSPWLMMFSLFFFFSLSMAKRHVEIVRTAARHETGRINGRGYMTTDAPLTLSLGISTACIAVMLLFLYVANDAYPINAYRNPEWLWAIAPLVFLWTTRIWLKSHRGQLDDDPIFFALRDSPSLGLGLLVGLAFVMATL